MLQYATVTDVIFSPQFPLVYTQPLNGSQQAARNMAAEWSEQRPVGLGGKVRQRVSAPVTAPQYTEAFHWDSGRRF